MQCYAFAAQAEVKWGKKKKYFRFQENPNDVEQVELALKQIIDVKLVSDSVDRIFG